MGVALTSFLAVLAVAAGALVGPRAWREHRDDLVPGLLTVARPAQGRVLLAGEVFVELFPSGLRISRRGRVVWEGVVQGAFLGGVDDGRVLPTLAMTTRRIDQYSVTYGGRLTGGGRSLDVRVRVSLRDDGRILLSADAPGADTLVLHGGRPATLRIHGAGERTGTFDLAGGRWRTRTPFYVTSRLAGLAVDAPDGTGTVLLDLGRGGRADVVVGDDEIRARLYDGTSPRELLIDHTADSGRARPLPDWALRGALVEVPPAEVGAAVRSLRAARARLSAVVLPGRPDPAACTRVRGTGLRALVTVRPHDLGVADVRTLAEPTPAATAARRLLDLVRACDASGWHAAGGAADPLAWARVNATAAAQLADEGAEPPLWWQTPATETSPALAPLAGQRERPSSWEGLADAVSGKLSAGVSGATLLASGVGGSGPQVRALRPDRRRTPELLARWAEVEALGTVLRTEVGSDPDAPQVWDAEARAGFARATRLLAATASYRAQAVETARRTGIPVVRPVWLDVTSGRPAREVDEFLLGDSLLVVPALADGARTVDALLPVGRWVDVWTGRTYGTWRTSSDVTLPAPLGRPLLLYRDGDPRGPELRESLRREGLL